ncbi:rhamnulokinase [Paenibacillus sp. HN-1]|uniref:rhamnulokinase n=1 Tax=Paenibacillus TaxID=44249 RepID=UPI001CA81AD7|nr:MULTISPECIES: rhamnulokinase [Paenibacillus]MBY9081335.1 rhamnulokinase [Paenibacillus sp. CGMCC 1.18879]MBY9086480.1 rhamnulokinase [Paenibacillus sinensis]
MIYHIAVDIGASSGRLVLGTLKDGKLSLSEIHRFGNGFTERDGSCFWDIEYLFSEIIAGLKKAKSQGIDCCTLGIDTWAVDYVLLDEAGERIQEVYAYRDRRTDFAMEQLAEIIPPETVYGKTGIQQLSFNTLYQLFVHNREELSRAESILMVPDYLYYRLTGKKVNEMTNASTMQLLNLDTRDFDKELLDILGIRKEQFPGLTEPGAMLGPVSEELVQLHDLPECQVIVAATHDTASAVLGVPAAPGCSTAYLSSGTWSLLGVELTEPLNTSKAMAANYTNEWGAYGTFRFLKNIMGLWLIQEVRRLGGNKYSFAELADLASEAEPFRSLIPCNDDRFLNPESMIEEIRRAAAEHGEPVPESMGQIARCIFDSLALSYRTYTEELEELTGRSIEILQIVGGGANNALLCRLTANVLNREVLAGPTESTALGNLIVQMISSRELQGITAAREVIRDSFDIKHYKPESIPDLDHILNRWNKINEVHTAPGARTN